MAGRSLPVLIAGTLFVATLVYAATALDETVAVYFWPGVQPDVVYPKWLYLGQQAVLGPVVAWVLTIAFAGPMWAIGETFMPRVKAGSRVTRWPSVHAAVMAWAVTCVAAGVWVAIIFDNNQHLARSLTEAGIVVVAVLGTFVIVVAALRTSRTR